MRRSTITPEAHKGLAEGYVSGPRLTAYYDKIAPGCAFFLRDAIAAYVKSGEGKQGIYCQYSLK